MSLWDSFQELRVNHALELIIPMNARTSELGESVGRLESALASDIDKLTLVCQALWSLLEENTDVTLEDLEGKLGELETQDKEVLDAIDQARTSCPRCNATIPANMDKCQFCGFEVG
jgi:hypothetical protein